MPHGDPRRRTRRRPAGPADGRDRPRIEAAGRTPTARSTPWPWTINVEGEGHIYNSKAEVIAAVRGYQAHGVRSIDVGCMQVNLMYHPDAFASLDQAYDPAANAVYAAHFLNELYATTHNWQQATALYHSATPRPRRQLPAQGRRRAAR